MYDFIGLWRSHSNFCVLLMTAESMLSKRPVTKITVVFCSPGATFASYFCVPKHLALFNLSFIIWLHF